MIILPTNPTKEVTAMVLSEFETAEINKRASKITDLTMQKTLMKEGEQSLY